MAATSINCLAVVLKELDWSYTRLIAELRRQAALDGILLPKTESLIPLISRWVNNHQQPDDFYRELLSRATGRHRFELFSDEAAVALLAARTNSGIAPIVAVESDEDMNRRQLLARTAALAAALAADPLVAMSGTATRAGDALLEPQTVPIGEAEREIVAAIRRVLLGVGSPPTGNVLSGDPDVMVLNGRVNEAWNLRQGSHYMELGQLLPGLLVDARSPVRKWQATSRRWPLVYSHTATTPPRLCSGSLATTAWPSSPPTGQCRQLGRSGNRCCRPQALTGSPTPSCRPAESLRPRRSRYLPRAAWNPASTPRRRMLRPGVASF
jgi:hypothetical protein